MIDVKAARTPAEGLPLSGNNKQDHKVREKLSEASPHAELTVVGIGASAGGLTALKLFFDHVPADSGLVFVVVIHLAPDHKSLLADLLQPHAKCPVQQVTETTALEPNHVYVIPPNANLSAIDTHLRLSDLEESRGQRAPIDHFFRTLAATHDGHSVGVVLTGTGSDGTLGIRDIKAAGGLIIVQDANEAEYDGMPRSALATGLADLILPVAQIPEAILRFARTKPRLELATHPEVQLSERTLLHNVFSQLRDRTDRDFSRYKRSTMLRRIARRMQINHLEDLHRYVDRLNEQPEELQALADDLLITVTNFFRDPAVFEKLEKDVIPQLFHNRGPSDSVRVWSAGCATGEEAYSIAMLLLDEARQHAAPPQIQIFASDLHATSLEKAREGFYPGDIEADVSSDRLRRFFTTENGSYRIRKEVRELVVFARHNLLGDPPFSRLDLITCRNLLIYLERDVQRGAVELFHYALSPEGTLILGSAETIDSSDLFRAEDKKLCFYRKRNVPALEPRLPVFPLTRRRLPEMPELRAPELADPLIYGTLHQKMVERYAPPSLLVSSDNKLVHLSEHAGRYLVHPGGEVTANVFKLVREELRIELQGLLQTVREKKQAADSNPIPVRFDGESCPVVLHAAPALDLRQEGFALIIFEERGPAKPGAPEASINVPPYSEQSMRINDLQNELELSRARMRSIIEDYETGQEEMKASNEEMQSANEELRSTMEELETSKEELQSINEELQTVNQENRHKVEELAQLSSDLQNLLSATGIATLFLDRSLRILRFTPKLSELFNLRITDRGRPISDLTHRLTYSELPADAQTVLDQLSLVEREVQDDDGHWYLTRLLPYRSTDDHIEGVVITFVDITRRVDAETALRGSEVRVSAELDSMQHLHKLVASLLISPDLSAALETVLESAISIMGANMGNIQLLNPADKTLEMVAQRGFSKEFVEHFGSLRPAVGSASDRALKSGERVIIGDVQLDLLYAPYRKVAASAGYRAVQSTPLVSHDGRVLGTLSTYSAQPHIPKERDTRILDLYTRQAADFVERCLSEEALRHSEERYRLLIENAREYAILMLDLSGCIGTWNSGAERIFGYTEKETVGRAAALLFTEEDRAAGIPQAEIRTATEQSRASDERWHLRKDGSRFWASGAIEALYSDGGILSGFVKVLRDNSERKKAEESLREQEKHLVVVNEALSRANANLKQFAFAASHDLREPLRTVAAYSKILVDSSHKGDEVAASRAAQFIVEGTERMSLLLNDLLAYTQLTIDEDDSSEPVDLNPVIENTLHDLKTGIEQSNALVTYDLLPVVRGRESHYSQLFQNILSNAIKYRSDRPLTIHISAERSGDDWRLAITDNGIGIDAAYQEQIFGVFKRLHNNKIPGTGIGLAICRRVVERFGGRIWVESAVNEGSTFFVTVPASGELAKTTALG